MALLFPQRTGQSGVFKVGSPNYVITSAGTAQAGMVTFLAKRDADLAAGAPWDTGDRVGVLVKKDDTNWQVWIAAWDDSSYFLVLDTLEASLGSISNNDSVAVIACVTTKTLSEATEVPASARTTTYSGTDLTLSLAHAGRNVRFTSSAAVTVIIPDDLPVGFHCVALQSGAGLVTFARSGTDTINGEATNKSLGGPFSSGYLVQPIGGAWELFA